MYKNILMVMIAVFTYNINAVSYATEKTPAFGLVKKPCIAILKSDGWGIRCPNVIDENNAINARNAPLTILPGYNSDVLKYEPEDSNYETSPVRCAKERIRFGDHATQFIAGIRRNVMNGNRHSLTSSAAYALINIIKPYARSVDQTATMKYRASARGATSGDVACAEYFDFAYNEISRITHIVVSELNKGNRDLNNTGINPRTSPYNR